MYGWLPNLNDTAWEPPEPKRVSKEVIKARGDIAQSAMETMRQLAEKDTGKPHKWVEDGDHWRLDEA